MSGIGPGDVVVCVAPFITGGDTRPKRGSVWRVIDIRWGRGKVTGRHVRGLQLHGLSGAWSIERFRKIDKADEQFIADMRALRPTKRSVDA